MLANTAESLQVEVPCEEEADTEFLQAMADGVPVWRQVKQQRASGPWTIASLVGTKVVVPWWPKLRSGGRIVFVSSTSAQELAELVETASAAESSPVFDLEFLASAANRTHFFLLLSHSPNREGGPPPPRGAPPPARQSPKSFGMDTAESGYNRRTCVVGAEVITARHRNIALLVAGCYFMEMLDGTDFLVP